MQCIITRSGVGRPRIRSRDGSGGRGGRSDGRSGASRGDGRQRRHQVTGGRGTWQRCQVLDLSHGQRRAETRPCTTTDTSITTDSDTSANTSTTATTSTSGPGTNTGAPVTVS